MSTSTNKIAAWVLAVACIAFLVRCSKNDTPAGKSKKLVFKAEASAGAAINLAVYGYDATLTTASSLSGTTWTSPEVTAPASASLASLTVNAIGVNAASTLKVQVYVNGVLKKEGTSSGTALSATAQYNLK